MSAHNLGSQLDDAVIVNPQTTGRIMFHSTTTPTDGVAGFARGCLWVNTNSTATNATRLYINAGSDTSATWKAFTHAS